jgi:hypothetical protein
MRMQQEAEPQLERTTSTGFSVEFRRQARDRGVFYPSRTDSTCQWLLMVSARGLLLLSASHFSVHVAERNQANQCQIWVVVVTWRGEICTEIDVSYFGFGSLLALWFATVLWL